MSDGVTKTNDTPDLEVEQSSLERYEHDAQGNALAVRSLDDIKRLSTIFIESGMFKQDRNLTQKQQLYQAGVKIIAGVEFGIQPFAAMRGINIINGNAEMSANLMAAKVKKHPKYDYRVTKWDDDGCVIKFFEIPYPGAKKAEWDELGESEFTLKHAETAQLASGQNWKKFARNMFFARAMSNGVRIYTPDVFYGAPVYVEGEIGGEIGGEFDNKAPEPKEAKPEEPIKKDDPVEGEVVQDEGDDDWATEEQIEKIKELSKQGGYGDDWFANVVMKINTVADADEIITKLEEVLRQDPTERTWK